ncbi:hypothetical protein QR680_004307 [Steinernema hermaphroditum]|uniref:Uncharacterized protein n=1 Tax=Steinernema hermaphroditum TaxID=289476 RepID=A0AA39HQI1_9BILA|nr:hypothetical protein QR680_004307 [Steinernema hermaphroditum]
MNSVPFAFCAAVAEILVTAEKIDNVRTLSSMLHITDIVKTSLWRAALRTRMTFVLGGLNRTGYTSYGKVDALIRQLELSMHDNVAYDVCNDETDKAFEKMEQSVRAVREFIDALR